VDCRLALIISTVARGLITMLNDGLLRAQDFPRIWLIVARFEPE
jgi:hypothetical protein